MLRAYSSQERDTGELDLVKVDKDSVFYASLTNFQRKKQDFEAVLSGLNSIKFYNKTKGMVDVLNVIEYDIFKSINQVYGDASNQEERFALSKELMNFYLEEKGLVGIVIFLQTDARAILYVNPLHHYEEFEEFARGFFVDKANRKIIGEFEIVEKNELFYVVEITRKNKTIEVLTPIVFK